MTGPGQLGSNYFEIFGLPVGFDIDVSALSQVYRRMQSAAHPDRYASGNDQERRLSVQRSATINDAYQTLKHPLSRARYLLELNGMAPSDGDSITDTAFLMEQMELREQLEQAAARNDAALAESLLRDVEASVAQQVTTLRELFARGDAAALQSARECVRRLQFMEKLRDQLHELESGLL